MVSVYWIKSLCSVYIFSFNKKFRFAIFFLIQQFICLKKEKNNIASAVEGWTRLEPPHTLQRGTLSASEYPNKNKRLCYLRSKIWLQYVSVGQCVGGWNPEWQSQPSAWPCHRCVTSSWFMAPGAPLSLFLSGSSVFSSGGWRKVMLSTVIFCCLLVWQLISKQEGREAKGVHFTGLGQMLWSN